MAAAAVARGAVVAVVVVVTVVAVVAAAVAAVVTVEAVAVVIDHTPGRRCRGACGRRPLISFFRSRHLG